MRWPAAKGYCAAPSGEWFRPFGSYQRLHRREWVLRGGSASLPQRLHPRLYHVDRIDCNVLEISCRSSSCSIDHQRLTTTETFVVDFVVLHFISKFPLSLVISFFFQNQEKIIKVIFCISA